MLNQLERVPFKFYSNNLIVTARACFGADNVWLFSPDLFVDRIRRDNFEELHVFAVDCEDLITSGFLMILEKSIRERRLPKDKIKIIAFQNPNISWATFVQWNPLPLNGWVIQTINKADCQINNSNFSKTFLSLSNRSTIYRIRLTKYIHQNFLENTFLSCRASSSRIQTQLSSMDKNFYSDEIDWCQNLPIHLDYAVTGNDYLDMMKSILQYKDKYFIEIIVESEIHNPHVFTEKTMRGFYTGKPFIVFAGPGALQNLRNWGFKTFSPFINENYDLIENTEDRFQAICDEIRRINSIPKSELLSIAHEYQTIFEHNQNIFFEHKHFWKDWDELEYSKELYG